MGELINIVTPLHRATKRDYVGRMMNDKVHCMLKAKEYEFDYWDGDRKYGFGGYKYDGRWKVVAESLSQSDAESFSRLPEIPKEEVDVIINIESSHCYSNFN